jgi:amino-acid N-acetyltransferase
MISKARLNEIPEIHRLLAEYSGQWNILPRSLAELYSFVRDFFVYREDGRGPILGIAALHVFWEDLGEIRSLMVIPAHQGRGIGTRLVQSCLEEARTLGLKHIFVLTDRLDFFQRFGFREFPREKLHPRIWADCVQCLKFPHCDEIPMVLNLLESP